MKGWTDRGGLRQLTQVIGACERDGEDTRPSGGRFPFLDVT